MAALPTVPTICHCGHLMKAWSYRSARIDCLWRVTKNGSLHWRDGHDSEDKYVMLCGHCDEPAGFPRSRGGKRK